MPKAKTKSKNTLLDKIKSLPHLKHMVIGLFVIGVASVGVATLSSSSAATYYNASSSPLCQRHSNYSPGGRYVYDYLGSGYTNGNHFHKYRRWDSITGGTQINYYYGCLIKR